MIQKAIEILKMRWPEVMLIVVIQAAMMLFSEELNKMMAEMTPKGLEMSFGASFLLGVGCTVCMVVCLMLYLGFLKTSAVGGINSRQPKDLLRFGRPYFWRMILFGFALFIFMNTIVVVLASVIWDIEDATQIPEWFMMVCSLAITIFLIKPLLFIPARMIVFDNSVFEAFFAVRNYRMNDINNLLKLVFGGMCVIVIFSFIVNLAVKKTSVYYILSGVSYVLASLFSLLVALTTVLFVQEDLEQQQALAEKEESQE